MTGRQPKEPRLRKTKVAEGGVQKCPLFQRLDTEQVRLLRLYVIAGDEAELLEDALEPIATEMDCYNLLGSDVTRDVHLLVQAIGLTSSGKEDMLAEREVHVHEQPEAPTRKGPMLVKDPETAVRVRTPPGVTVASREQVVVPHTISVREARESNRENASIALVETMTKAFTRSMEEGARVLFSQHAQGVKEILATGMFDDRVRELKEQLSEKREEISDLKSQLKEQKSNYLTERTQLELDVLKKTREWIAKEGELEKDIRAWKKKYEEAKEDADMREGLLKKIATETALEHGPGIIGQILEKLGVKIDLPAPKKEAAA